MTPYDLIVVGSGFGGTSFAHTWVQAGKRVLLLERGNWVTRGEACWSDHGSMDLTPYYDKDVPYRVVDGDASQAIGCCSCVGGPSVFYGTVSLRFREQDFVVDSEIVGDSQSEWPIAYRDLEPFYGQAEKLLDVAGTTGSDPTEPPRRAPYPQTLPELAPAAQKLFRAAEQRGLKPFRLPLAISYGTHNGRTACIACRTCDTFACAIGAKNDLATQVIPRLITQGMTLMPNTLAQRIVVEGRSVVGVEVLDKTNGTTTLFPAHAVALAGGALGSPHLLLASGLDRLNPAGENVGRYLTRHCSGLVYGIFPRLPDPHRQFHKQIGIHDFYFGHSAVKTPHGKLGSLQQVHNPPIGLVRATLPKLIRYPATFFVEHMTGLLTMAEDQPQASNHVRLGNRRDAQGLPELEIVSHYSDRDLAARRALNRVARSVLRRAGAWATYTREIKTFSHALGTVRMGNSPKTAPLDPGCRFRGLTNLFVVDGSALPRSAGVNPSLTITANALRAGTHALTANLTEPA